MGSKMKNEHNTRSAIDWRQIIYGVIVGVTIGAILGAGSTFFVQGQKIAKLEEQVRTLRETIQLKSNIKESSLIIPKKHQEEPKVKPEKLITIIKEQQKKYVRESWDTDAYQCFTDEDLEKFEDSGIPRKIVEKLKKNNQFIDVVLAIKEIPPSKWQDLKERSLKTYKPTWAELGKISREGQTEAGQKAEKTIAEAIVELVVELLKKSKEDIKKLYSY